MRVKCFTSEPENQRGIHYCLTNELMKIEFNTTLKIKNKKSQARGTLEVFGSTTDGPSVVVGSTVDRARGASSPSDTG